MVVNYRSNILRLVLPVILLCISGNIFAQKPTSESDDWLLQRLFEYKTLTISHSDTTTRQIYTKHTLKSLRRNPTLFLVPTMYSIAKGQRDYIRESFGVAQIVGADIIGYQPKLLCGTIRKNRLAMPILLDYITPDLYSELLFGSNVLSPFHKDNKRYYEYQWSPHTDSTAMLIFNSRLSNTQLVDGWAAVDNKTGRIISCQLKGAFDMINFNLHVDMGSEQDKHGSLVPERSDISSTFMFLGNKVEYQLVAQYDNHRLTLPDTLITEQALMDAYRPMELSSIEKQIYRQYNWDKQMSQPDTTRKDTLVEEGVDVGKKALELIEDNLLSSIKANSERASIRVSPLLDPLKLSYSNRRGLSYRMKIDTKYSYTANRYITLKPRVGYNFKINKLYYSTPLRYTLDERKNNWVELLFANGNRITHSSVSKAIEESNDSTVMRSDDDDQFNDQYLKLHANTAISSKVDVALGITYHKRKAANKHLLNQLGLETCYKTFAPTLTLSYRPNMKWPMFSVNYERSIKGVLGSNIGYERWEFDSSFKRDLGSLRKLNIRTGGGFYTDKSTNHFVDFENFQEEYLPEGWDDEWTGNFQLLSSSWYNQSKYYARMNASYESPLMLVSRLPLAGKYIETERLYLGVLSIEHTRPYFELGYGFTCRYFSVGAFTGFLNSSFQEFGCKFTFELFRRW